MLALRHGIAGFANMFGIGTIYAASTLQIHLPRLLKLSEAWSFAPFGVASMGLSLGVALCPSFLNRYDAHLVAAWATTLWGFALASAGYFLMHLNFKAFLLSFFLGGGSVGSTYLAVVILIGQAFPNHALARSAIGPMGFSLGAASCILFGTVFQFETLNAAELGQFVIQGGVACIAIGILTIVLIPTMNKPAPSPPSVPDSVSSSGLFSTILFFNASPGMVLFAGLIPITSYYNKEQELPYYLITLAASGFLAPTISRFLGPRTTFVLLFALRGLLLIFTSRSSESVAVVPSFMAVLFSHGAGFSILPGLIKAQSSSNLGFAKTYAQVLVSWGLAGALASLINAFVLTSSGGYDLLNLLIGTISLSFSAILFLCSPPGRLLA